MSGEYVDPVALRNKARETFIAKRTVQEQKFNAWYEALLKCPQDKVLDKIPFDYHNMTLQSLVPEWYVDAPDAATCDEQLKAANEKIDIVNKIIDDLNREGVKRLEEYNELYSRK